MSKFNPISLSKITDKKGYSFQCPGCKCAHYIQTNPNFSPCWTFNGDLDKPTVSPSIMVHLGQGGSCHSFIKNGKIQFLGDCTHSLRGQTVNIPDWEE